jgi:hypothetical protein
MNAVVGALNSLSIFGPHQAGAYREHAQSSIAVLGPGVATRAGEFIRAWGASEESGTVVLTGNAGTGKTALAEGWCGVVGGELPSADGLAEVAPSRWVVKDLSGVLPAQRAAVLELASGIARSEIDGQLLLCANEGLFRAALADHEHAEFASLLDDALLFGAAAGAPVLRATVMNMNRQRWTEPELWRALCDYLTGESLWEGCTGCAAEEVCPILANARALQKPEPREAFRRLVQLASGSTVATLRELLSIFALGITGGLSCDDVTRAAEPFDAEHGYFNLLLGASLSADRVERSTLLQAMLEAEIGSSADLSVDGWLRDAGSAPPSVGVLADPPDRELHSQVRTKVGEMSFAELGETITVSDDPIRVAACLEDFAEGRRFLSIWRRRVYFEAQSALGGYRAAFARLSAMPFFGDLVGLAEALRDGREPGDERSRLIRGLNYLAAGFHSYPGSLVVPDPASLAARNPGQFREPDPSVVHHDIPVSDVELRLEDGDPLRSRLDADDVRLVFAASTSAGETAELVLTPRLYQAIRESHDYRAPIGADIPEMAELAAFYAALATTPASETLRIVDPGSGVIKEVALPDLLA